VKPQQDDLPLVLDKCPMASDRTACCSFRIMISSDSRDHPSRSPKVRFPSIRLPRPRFLPEVIHAGVVGDSKNPAGEFVLFLIFVESGKNASPGQLKQILGRHSVPYHFHDEGKKRFVVPMVQDFERRLHPVSILTHQKSVGFGLEILHLHDQRSRSVFIVPLPTVPDRIKKIP